MEGQPRVSWKTLGIVVLAVLACPCSWPTVAFLVGWLGRAIGLSWPVTLGLVGSVALGSAVLIVLRRRARATAQEIGGACCVSLSTSATPARQQSQATPDTETNDVVDARPVHTVRSSRPLAR
ncbi:MAG: hypothetical protein IRY86_04435 [Thermorudis peleae]|nr:hypothetical protein [Thermorudis peleae]